MAIPHSLKLIRLLRKAWSTLKQSNARRDKNQKKRAKASLPSVLSQIHELDTIYVETASDMKVVQTLINAKQPWKGTHIVVKTRQDATTATIKQKAVELKLEVIESGRRGRTLKVLWNLGEETLVGRTPTPTTTTPEQATVEGLTSTRQEMDNKVAEAPSSGTTNPDA
ncbi:unnamed protein product [Prunus armeniaca]|uniref:Uncharacterized protein n=1 Tax=Prunus armeniaca TaxID=36596 RepID=A0A6J5VF74_PRUAR|nr:unnamed protein product [Prunus armeniaca]